MKIHIDALLAGLDPRTLGYGKDPNVIAASIREEVDVDFSGYHTPAAAIAHAIAQANGNDGCPGCGGSDIDLAPAAPMMTTAQALRAVDVAKLIAAS